MNKKNKGILLMVFALTVVFGFSIFISLSKFGITNPFSVISGLYQISCTNTKYVEIQAYPKVVISKSNTPNDLLSDYMKTRGLHENKEGRLGSIFEFKQEEHTEYVHFSTNRYYSLWTWIH